MCKVVIVMVAVMGVLWVNRQLPFFPIFYDKAEATAEEGVVAEKKIDLDLDGRTEIVQKIHTKTDITVRILEEVRTKHSPPLAQFTFPLSEDGFIFLKTHFSNLGFADINDDGQLEILISVFEKKSKKNELKILQWNKKEKILEQTGGED